LVIHLPLKRILYPPLPRAGKQLMATGQLLKTAIFYFDIDCITELYNTGRYIFVKKEYRLAKSKGEVPVLN
jgi:hypothetical protein